MTDPTLLDVLQATLLPRGFAATNARGRFVRTVGVMRQVVGLRNGRDGDGSAVYFLLEEGPAGSDGSYELSPVAPFKNTWWWPSHLASHDAATLVVSLENQALAWFEAWEQGFDPGAGAAGLLAQLEPLQDALPAFRQRAFIPNPAKPPNRIPMKFALPLTVMLFYFQMKQSKFFRVAD
jgi:hypothetical protein